MKGSKQLKDIAAKAVPSEAEVEYPPPKIRLRWKRDMDDLPGHVRRAERES